jgi:hypothetical protein
VDDFFIFVQTSTAMKMKKPAALILVLLISTFALAQKKEKIKGSKIVTIEQNEIGSFEKLEVGDNIEVYLDKGEESEVKIEADDNLHDIIKIDLKGKTLKIYCSKTATNYKKLIARITYTEELKAVTSKNESVINAVQEIQLNEITFKSFDESKLFLNVNSKNFILGSENNSKTELHLISEKTTIQLSGNSNLKAMITSSDLKCDLYQKSKAKLEGDISAAALRMDNDAQLTANNLTILNVEIVTESYSKASILATSTITIDASGNSEVQLYGEPKIELKRFMDNVILSKKPIK